MKTATRLQRFFPHNHNRRMTGVKLVCLLLSFFTASALTSPAQTLTTLVIFNGGSNGEGPHSAPVQGTDGNFYGATGYGGHFTDSGTMYKMTPDGSLTTLYYASETTAALPFENFLLTPNGNFYSMSTFGGMLFGGTVFEMTPAGRVTILYQFCTPPNCSNVDGESPFGALVLGTNGNFYGSTESGGPTYAIDGCGNGCGTVFKMTPKGALTTLYSFCAQLNCTDGAHPWGALVQGANGNLYGTTSQDGANGGGSVFELTLAGQLTTLYSFCSQPNCSDGGDPVAGLVQAADGNFYGTTEGGGSSNNGTVFEITPAGTFTSLYSFCSQAKCTDGGDPQDAPIQATDGNFYGTTLQGGAHNAGTLFEISPAGKLTTLYSFCSQPGCTDGIQPIAGLTQATNGTFYGSTSAGGSANRGTIFTFSNGLAPFAQTVPAFGKVGAEIIIIGNNLTGTTSVSFNGTSAAFTVVSDTEITATVPSGATSGTVQVSTPGGTLNSNVVFRILP